MNKIVIVVVILLLGVGGYYFYSKMKTGGIPGGPQVSSGQMSLKDLVASGLPQKCTFVSTDESGKTEGTSYVSGGKVRADSTLTAGGKATTSHIISDGKTGYIWTEGEANGFMMTVGESESTETSSEADLSQKADYNCSTWLPDNSLFTPPSDVKFTDFSQMLQPTSMPAGIENTGSQCAYCETLTGEDKASCLSALQCE